MTSKHGFSVREVIQTVEGVSGRKLSVREAPRRPGDVAEIVADSSKLQAQLGWKPLYDDLQQIVSTAFNWERRLNSAS